uniref:Uncharacterized protein n=1 Tax=Dikerogammarus haemobaphes virus 1 TaxID=2704946 RepID=A0A6G9HDE3_9VIRU|nr:hypothetical protein [Dikerogammarus haemobaphes virus 1]
MEPAPEHTELPSHNSESCLMSCDICNKAVVPSRCSAPAIIKATHRYLRNLGQPTCLNCNNEEDPHFEKQMNNLIKFCIDKKRDCSFQIFPNEKMIYLFNAKADRNINSYSYSPKGDIYK